MAIKLGLEWSFTPTKSELDTWMHWLGFFFVAWLVDYFWTLQMAVILAIAGAIGLEFIQKYFPSQLDVAEKKSKPAPQVRDLIADGLGIGFYASLMTAGFQGWGDWIFTAGSFFFLVWQWAKSRKRVHKF